MMPKEVFEDLFDEKKLKVLRWFVNRPDAEFYLREVARAVDVSPATTYRIINKLVDLRLLRVNKVKKTKLYRLANNEKTEILSDIFEEKKGAVEEFVDFARQIEGVEKIILHDKKAEKKTNILVIGKGIDTDAINRKIGEIKGEYGINIIELTLDPQQYKQMAQMGLFPGKKKQLWPE